MASLSEEQLLHLLLALGITLVAARGLGEVARRAGLPEVLGQLLAGVALGPSLLGPLLPGVYDALFGDPPAANGLSAVSWLGAILIFLSAGTEADLRVLRIRGRSGLLVAAGAVVPSIAIGALIGWLVLGQELISGVFLGVALSVTAVSVLVAILDERGAMRRDYGQVLLAAGVVSEMTVWVFIPVVAALLNGSPSPLVAAVVAVAGVTGVFLFMLSVGQLVVHAALRWVADHARIVRSPISVILAVTLLSAALSEALGLHPLLGAFAAGMVLVRAPRVRPPLLQSVQTLTTGFLAPLFFAFAGTRVNLRELGGWDGVLDVLVLLVVAGAVKVGSAYLMGRTSGMRAADARIAAVGMNLKGGTDVIVALVGTELGFFSTRVYSVYGAVAIVTVLLSSPVLSRLDRADPPTPEEQERLDRETALEGGYLNRLERVVDAGPEAAASPLTASVLRSIEQARRRQGLAFDIVRAPTDVSTNRATELGTDLHADLAGRTDLVAIALAPAGPDGVRASGPGPSAEGSTAAWARVKADLIVTSGELGAAGVRQIVVPFDGRPPAFAALDVAACLAEQLGADLVPVRVRPAAIQTASHDALDGAAAGMASSVDREVGGIGGREGPDGQVVLDDLRSGAQAMDALLRARLGGGGPAVRSVVIGAPDVATALLSEVSRTGDGLVVMGTTAHRGTARTWLGRTVDAVLAAEAAPVVVVVTQ